MKLVAVNRLAMQWRFKVDIDLKSPVIEAICAEKIVFEETISHAKLLLFGPGEFLLRVARDDIRIHSPKSWCAIEKSLGTTKEVALQWHSDAERAAFARDLLLARQSELFSPAGM